MGKKIENPEFPAASYQNLLKSTRAKKSCVLEGKGKEKILWDGRLDNSQTKGMGCSGSGGTSQVWSKVRYRVRADSQCLIITPFFC